MMDRLRGEVGGVNSPVGTLPKLGDLDLHGLDMDVRDANEILSVNAADIERDARDVQSLLALVGESVPAEVWSENAETIAQCGA
jgi:phosphoenolpyruvate carboxykinase (GTP)